jgi:Restriction endonuclease
MSNAIVLLQEQVKNAEALKQLPRYSPQYKIWRSTTTKILREHFTDEYADMFNSIWSTSPRYASQAERRKAFLKLLEEQVQLLDAVIQEYTRFQAEPSIDISRSQSLQNSEHQQQSMTIHEDAVNKEEDNQQHNKERESSSAVTKALLFYNFVHDLLQNLGFRVVTQPMVADTGVDFLAYYTATSPVGTTKEQVWVVEVKYRNLAGTLSRSTLDQLYAYAKVHKASKALLVTNITITKEAKWFATKNNKLEIWDIYKLLQLLNRLPELRLKYSEVIPQFETAINEEELVDKTPVGQHELIRELRDLPTGDGKAYEELIKRILEFCFHDEFIPFEVKNQVYTNNKKRIRDFIIDNRDPKKEFWLSLKWVRKVEKVLFDAKNYKNPVEYREILDTLRYLKNEAFGNFIIIISRRGIKDYEEALEDYSDNKQVALFLSDDDLVKMIKLKIDGKSPTLLIEDKYYDFLDKK